MQVKRSLGRRIGTPFGCRRNDSCVASPSYAVSYDRVTGIGGRVSPASWWRRRESNPRRKPSATTSTCVSGLWRNTGRRHASVFRPRSTPIGQISGMNYSGIYQRSSKITWFVDSISLASSSSSTNVTNSSTLRAIVSTSPFSIGIALPSLVLPLRWTRWWRILTA